MALNLDKEHNYLFDSNRPDCDKSTYLVFGDEVSGDSSMHHVSTFQPVTWRSTTTINFWPHTVY